MGERARKHESKRVRSQESTRAREEWSEKSKRALVQSIPIEESLMWHVPKTWVGALRPFFLKIFVVIFIEKDDQKNLKVWKSKSKKKFSESF